MRGEYHPDRNKKLRGMELPPRARRILHPCVATRPLHGTTSACAENTFLHHPVVHCPGNYLRVRGEYSRTVSSRSLILELPPRARRILVENMLGLSRYGTTSACAENTWPLDTQSGLLRNYLRVRGEYETGTSSAALIVELPPRARRIPYGVNEALSSLGTTSACAENTLNELGLL